MCLITGSDSRLRLWDVESGCDTLVNYETVRLQTSKPIQLATTQDSTLVFVPCMRVVKVYCSFSLLPISTLKLDVQIQLGILFLKHQKRQSIIKK